AQGERVHVLVEPSRGGTFARDVREKLQRGDVNLSHVSFHVQPTDRIWMRDSGPIFVTREKGRKQSPPPLALVDFKFNGWAKYDNSALDDALPAAVAKL